MPTDAMEEHTETKGDTAAAVATDAMEEHIETKGDTAAAVATDAMEEHTETKGDKAVADRVAPVESIVEATKADEEEIANRKWAAKVTNGMEGVTKAGEDAGATDTDNEEEVVIGVTGVGNEEGVIIENHILTLISWPLLSILMRELYGDNPTLHPPHDSNYTPHGGFNVSVLETALIRRRLDVQHFPSGGDLDHCSHDCAYILHAPDHYTALVHASSSWELWNGAAMVQTITAICDLVRN
ncbi:hypothetical protein CBR_g37588 [Chara braunii]|uniref:Uncharacterized protein n=1 Tax=Chara braunii TaxID=69332 RepID=A0A388LN98_CHABU|nr:hypothetical protein CBR_g37588 [Chara braunii]|eukprot:GBG83788.1 hypothetical protein CBR_g37588 [Chara braunii]